MPQGVKLPRMGLWPSLWALVHATAPPAHTTWGRLCGEASIDTIVNRLRAGAAAPPFSCYSWNARWVQASTPKAALRRQVVLDKVLAGQVVCVQETHWSEAQGYAWAGLFPAPQVAFAHAHTDPRGVTSGGVAVLVPHRTQIMSQRILVPGCAVECCTDYGKEGTRTFWSVYLPPGSQGSTLDLLWDAHPPANSTLVIAGDFSIEIVRPRIEEEGGLRDKLFAWFARLGVAPVPGSGHTRRGRKGKACKDAIAVPEGQAWRWRVARTWRSDLSDHARLQIVAGNRASVGSSCTLAAMRSLPDAALVDLRRIFTHVSLVLGSSCPRPASRVKGGASHRAPRARCKQKVRVGSGSSAPPPSDRRRARGTLLATAGAVGPRTRGEATSGRGDCHGRTDEPAQHPCTTGGEGGPPHPGGEAYGQGHEDRAEHDYVWDPVRALFIGPSIEHAIRGYQRLVPQAQGRCGGNLRDHRGAPSDCWLRGAQDGVYGPQGMDTRARRGRRHDQLRAGIQVAQLRGARAAVREDG